MKKLVACTLLLLVVGSIPIFVSANGGDQRVVDGKYLINLSRAPFTPRVGVKTAMLPSFFDIEKNKLIAEDLIVKVRIAKLGGAGSEKRAFIFEKDDIVVRGGVLEGLSYIFAESGLYEIFFDFAFALSPETIYRAPDFLIDVQPIANESTLALSLRWLIGGIIAGALTMWVLHNRL